MHVGLGEHREQALALPCHVVVAALRVLEVLDAVDALVPVPVADVVGQLDAVLGEHVVHRQPLRGVRERAVEVEEHGVEAGHAPTYNAPPRAEVEIP